MIVVEKKINALIDYVLASTQESRVKAMEQLRRLQFNETTGQPNVEAQVREILLRIGVPDSISGHGFLVTAIQMAVENPKIMLQKTKCLYPAVGAEHGKNGAAAERCMRHAIEVGFLRCDPDTIEEIFGSTVCYDKGRPTTSEFIARLAAIIRQKMQ